MGCSSEKPNFKRLLKGYEFIINKNQSEAELQSINVVDTL